MDTSGDPRLHRVISSRNWASLRVLLNSEESSNLFASNNFLPSGHSEPGGKAGLNAFHTLCRHSDRDVPADIFTRFIAIDEKNLSRKTNTDSKATPLHIACDATSSPWFVKTLLALKPHSARQLVSIMDGRGMTPLDVVWLRFIDPGYVNYRGKTNDAVQSDGTILASIVNFSDPDGDSHYGIVQEMWEKTLHILFAATTCEEVEPLTAWNVVHAAASTEIACPNIVMWLALSLHPEQVRWQDKDGNFPLHMVASCRNHYRYPVLPSGEERSNYASFLDSWDDEEVAEQAKATLDEAQASPVRMLVNIYPEAATVANKDGRYPIHLAAERGADWADEVEALFSAAPRTLNKRDPKTALLPFMLAAVDAEKDASLDLVYNLLRANPANVSGGIRNTRYEEYLEKKWEESKSELDESKSDIAEKNKALADKDAIIASLRSALKKRKADDL